MIELKNIYKTYLIGAHQVHALNGVDINITAGEFVSLMGASGSGKTTTMNILGLLDHPTSGEYYLNGSEVSQLDRKQLAYLRNRSIGFIFQSFFLLPRLNALQNVMLPLQYREDNDSDIKELALASLEKVGMQSYVEHRPNQLSGGQQQRVAIARALVTKPSIILADEPTGALDSKTGQEVMNLLMDIHRRENTTVIIVTHDMQVANQCERIIKLKDGKLVS
jgi:putative ABC transport system ATP-binding protein